jgi:zinc finger protein
VKKKKKSEDFESSLLISCPVCDKKAFNVVQKVDSIPYFGEVLETFAHCDSCKYKTSDVLPLEKKKAPKKQEKKVCSEKDLHVRIVKSKSAIIEIPEIKLRIEPGSGSDAYVTNIEGLLIRIIEKIKGFKKVQPENAMEFERVVNELKKMKNLKKKFTLIIRDDTGQSAILTKELKNL